MFFQPVETDTLPKKSPGALKSARRKRKKNALKNKIKKQAVKKAKLRFQTTMSSWAENFTMAATWQLKHSLAHWKSKAKALEYENNILKDLLRHYYVSGRTSRLNEPNEDNMSVKSDSEDDEEDEEYESSNEDEIEDNNEDNMELSEEFLEFLKGNAEFRKMREERARLRKLEEEMPMMVLEAGPQEPPKDSKEVLQELYGENWEKVAALETSVQSQFMVDCDIHKPVYWPNIPLRI